jgi:FdhD protein
LDTLNLEFLPNERAQIDITREDVATHQRRRAILQFECAAQLVENFEREKCDLTFVIVAVIKEPIAADAMPGHTLDHWNFDYRMIVRFATVMAKVIVPRRNVEVTDFHRRNNIESGLKMKEQPGIDSGQIIRRKKSGALEYLHDDLTVEEPLEIRIGRKTVATTMRTPGHDDELAAGFLLSEAIVRQKSDIAKLGIDSKNSVVVDLADGVKPNLRSAQRFGTISSSCGLCGKNSIEAIRQQFPPIRSVTLRVDTATLLGLPDRLRAAQSDFARTGGIHAAGIFEVGGDCEIVREDIGRHNAVDKAIGRAFLDELLPLDRHVLLVSGRASFEIVQKALAASVAIVASVSAPSSLAVNFARENNQTLIGFLRPPSFNIYAHIERVILYSG